MVIDDDVDLTCLLENILKDRKMHLLSEHRPEEPEDCLIYRKPTIIFLENSSSGGLGVNYILNSKSSGQEIKMIMMTADRIPL